MKTLLILLLFGTVLSCKKVKQQQETDILVSIMTSGEWKVSSMIVGNNDSTALFTGYQYRFNTNNTVDAIKNGSIENTGTWSGDINTRTIIAAFNNPSPSLKLLNATWLITDSSPVFVKAENSSNGITKTLQLVKI
jgi:hypothetical protein